MHCVHGYVVVLALEVLPPDPIFTVFLRRFTPIPPKAFPG